MAITEVVARHKPIKDCKWLLIYGKYSTTPKPTLLFRTFCLYHVSPWPSSKSGTMAVSFNSYKLILKMSLPLWHERRVKIALSIESWVIMVITFLSSQSVATMSLATREIPWHSTTIVENMWRRRRHQTAVFNFRLSHIRLSALHLQLYFAKYTGSPLLQLSQWPNHVEIGSIFNYRCETSHTYE